MYYFIDKVVILDNSNIILEKIPKELFNDYKLKNVYHIKYKKIMKIY